MFRRVNKYGATPATSVFFPGVVFPSKVERDRAEYLYASERTGDITGLELHPEYVLSVKPSCKVTFDSRYVEQGVPVVEDVKGAAASTGRDARVRFLWYAQLHPGVRVRVVTRDSQLGWKVRDLVKGSVAA